MILFYYPLILLSILGYGFIASKKIIGIKTLNLGFQGLIGIFSLLIISYFSTQFLAHTIQFNFFVLIIGLIFYFIYSKDYNKDKNFKLLFYLILLTYIFILVGKNHDDFHYYHFPYTIILTELPHPLGLGNLNHGFKTHSSIFLLSSLFSLPGAKYSLFNLGPAYILVFSNFIILKLIFDKNIQKKYYFITILALSSFVFINIFFYRLAEHGTDRSAIILIILLILNLLLFLNLNQKKIDLDNLKILTIFFTIIVSLKAFYLIYSILLLPLVISLIKKRNFNDIKIFLNKATFYSLILIIFVFLTNLFNTGCLIFPEKKTCFFELSWSLSLETVEYLSIHYENWAKAGSGAGYSISDEEKLIYISNFNWIENWFEKYFFNKVSDLILSLIFISLIFLFIFKGHKSLKKYNRRYKLLGILLFFIFLIWFSLHPTLRYGGYHLFYFLFFIPLSIFLEKYSRNSRNFNKKIITLIIITLIIFVGRNIARLEKENRIYSYKILNDINYPLNTSSFRYQIEIQNQIKDKKVKKIYRDRYILYK